MTLDEAIKDMETIAEENQRVVDTGIVFKDVTIDMLYCDDTEVIEEHLANYQRCAEKHRQLAAWLEELQAHRNAWMKVVSAIDRRTEIHSDGKLYIRNFDVKKIIAENIPRRDDKE